MDAKSLRELKPELELFLERYFPLFRREENCSHARLLMHGLLAGGDRRNVENIAEMIDGGVVQTLQKFIAQNAWDDRAILREMRQHLVEALGGDDAVMIVDETGFPKKGTKSAGIPDGVIFRTKPSLDEYETRGWISWHHHSPLSLMALWFLTLQKLRLGKKTPATHGAGGPQRAPTPARSSTLGRKRNPPLVSASPKTQRTRQSVPHRAARTGKTVNAQ